MDELVKNSGFEKMILDIEALVNASKNELATSINKVMTVTYWSIGKYIVEFEQDGNAKAEYGKSDRLDCADRFLLFGRGRSRAVDLRYRQRKAVLSV